MFTAFNPGWARMKADAKQRSPQTAPRKSESTRKVKSKPTHKGRQRTDKTQGIPLQDLSHLRPAVHAERAVSDFAPRPSPLSGSSSSSSRGSPSSRRSSSSGSMVSAKTHLSTFSVPSSRCGEIKGGGTDVIDFGDPVQVPRGWYRSRALPLPSQETLDREVVVIAEARKREVDTWQKHQDEEAEKRKVAKQQAAKQRQTEAQARMHLAFIA